MRFARLVCCCICRVDTMDFYMKSRFHIMRGYFGRFSDLYRAV